MGSLVKGIISNDIFIVDATNTVSKITKFDYIVFSFTFSMQNLVAHSTGYEGMSGSNRLVAAATHFT